MTSPQRCIARATFVSLICLWTVAARAQDISAATAAAESPSWIIPDLAAAARAEGALRVFSPEEGRGGPAVGEVVGGARGGKSELCALVRSHHSVAHRDGEQRPAARVGSRGPHCGDRAPKGGAAEFRPAAGA